MPSNFLVCPCAYDFLLMREAAGEMLDNLGDWWTRYQDSDDQQRKNMVGSLNIKQQKGRSGTKLS